MTSPSHSSGVVQQIFRSCCDLPALRIQLVEGLQGSIQKLTKDAHPRIPGVSKKLLGKGRVFGDVRSDHHFKAPSTMAAAQDHGPQQLDEVQ